MCDFFKEGIGNSMTQPGKSIKAFEDAGRFDEPPVTDLNNVNKPGYMPTEFSARNYRTIPDSGERTSNDPSYLMSSTDVLKLIKTFYGVKEEPFYLSYQGEVGGLEISPNSGKEVIIELTVRKIISEAKKLGWFKVELIGKQLLFISNSINLR
jgi:hypothetical protein